jgi:hypothetical protein
VAKKKAKTRRTKAAASSAKKSAKPAAAKSAKESFVRAVITRGEAAACPPDQSLPPGVTHRIVRESKKAMPQIKRERFSAL